MLNLKLFPVIATLGLLVILAGACAQPAPAPMPVPVPSPSPTPTPSPITMPTPAPLGTVVVYVTDAPPRDEVKSILVTASQIEIHKALAEQEQTQEGEGEWITLDISDNTTTFDLLQIKGIEEFFATGQVEAGKYTQIRLTIDKVEVALGDKAPQEATLPSRQLKLVRPFEVVPSENTVIVLDFEADKMVTVTGAGKIIVKPVVKLMVRQEKSTGQKPGEVPEQEVSLEDTVWILQSYGELGNSKDIITDTEITAEFVSSEGTIKGSAGCNSYFGSYELEGSQLSIPGPIAATQMFCAEPEGAMDQEQEYLTALQSAESYEINGDELRINYGNQVLIFSRD